MNVIPVKKIGCAPFKVSDLMNLTSIKKISCVSSKAFDIKNSILIKTTQLALATLKAILAKAKKVAAAYLKKVNQVIKGIVNKILLVFVIYRHVINLYFKMLILLFYLISYYTAS